MVKRILLISNFGPLYNAEYIYKYLMREKVQVYTVGRIWQDSYPPFDEHYRRCNSNHLNIKFDWKKNAKTGEKRRYDFDLASVLDFFPGDFDAILECETQQLQLTDKSHILQKENIPYYYYKTELLIDYYNPLATHFFYSSDPVKDHLISLLPPDKKDAPMEYLPFSFDPEFIPKKVIPGMETYYNKMFFAGGIPPDYADQKYHKIYKHRKQIIPCLKDLLDGQFLCFGTRAFGYFEYLKMMYNSKLLFNIGVGCANYRDFEALALGKPLLTMWNPQYRQMQLKDTRDFYTFTTLNQAYKIAKSLLNQSNEDLAKVGQHAKDIFYQYHLPSYRAQKIIEVIYRE